MKKIVLILGLLLLLSQSAFASCNYTNQCAPKRLAPKGIGNFFSNASGSTFVAEHIVDQIIKEQLKKSLDANFNANLKAFDIGSLLSGKFKSLDLSGKDVNINGISITALKVKTLCGYNSVDIKSKPIKLKENMVLSFNGEISSLDLQRTMSNTQFASMIYKMNLSKIGLRDCRIYPETITISNGKLNFTMNGTPVKPPIRPIDIVVSSDFMVQNEKVINTNITTTNLSSNLDLTKLISTVNVQRHLKYNANVMGSDAQLQIENIYMGQNSIFFDGMILIKKS